MSFEIPFFARSEVKSSRIEPICMMNAISPAAKNSLRINEPISASATSTSAVMSWSFATPTTAPMTIGSPHRMIATHAGSKLAIFAWFPVQLKINETASVMPEITHMYIHIRDNEGKAKTFLLGKSADVFYQRMGEKVAGICDEKLKATDKLPSQLIHSHIASTFSDILKYWSENKFADTPAQVAEYFMILTDEVL